MRSVIGPALLLLMTAGLLYTGFHTNKRVLATTLAAPRAAPAAMRTAVRDLLSRAAAFHADLGRWPDAPEDLEIDAQRFRTQSDVKSLRFTDSGDIVIDLNETAAGIPALAAWTPRTTDDRVDWFCRTNASQATATALACEKLAAAELAVGASPQGRPDSEVAVTGVNERCQRLGRIAYAAAVARQAGDSLDTFTHRPLIAFVDDPEQRSESRVWAQRIFQAPPQSPGASQRTAMREQHCFKH
jgi:hypothetical protein